MAALAAQIADQLDADIRDRSLEIARLATLETIRDPKATVDAKRKLLNELQKTFSDYAWIGITEYASTVKFSGEALLTVINDILDFSKVEAGKISLESQSFDLEKLIKETHQALTPLTDAKKISMQFIPPNDRPRGYPHYEGDSTRIRQVITNLVGNAIKFTLQGSITLKVSADPTDMNGLLFEVIDTGIGIAPGAVDLLFQAFLKQTHQRRANLAELVLVSQLVKVLSTLWMGKSESIAKLEKVRTFGSASRSPPLMKKLHSLSAPSSILRSRLVLAF